MGRHFFSVETRAGQGMSSARSRSHHGKQAGKSGPSPVPPPRVGRREAIGQRPSYRQAGRSSWPRHRHGGVSKQDGGLVPFARLIGSSASFLVSGSGAASLPSRRIAPPYRIGERNGWSAVSGSSSLIAFHEEGGGFLARPLVSFYLLVAAIDRVADGDSVSVDGSSCLGDREAVVFVGDEGGSLSLGDSVVGLIDGLILGLIGAGVDGAGVGLGHHIGVPFVRCLFPFDTYKIPRHGQVIYTK